MNTNGYVRQNKGDKGSKKVKKSRTCIENVEVIHVSFEEYYELIYDHSLVVHYINARYIQKYRNKLEEILKMRVNFKLYKFFHQRLHTEMIVFITRSKKELRFHKDINI